MITGPSVASPRRFSRRSRWPLDPDSGVPHADHRLAGAPVPVDPHAARPHLLRAPAAPGRPARCRCSGAGARTTRPGGPSGSRSTAPTPWPRSRRPPGSRSWPTASRSGTCA
ncbi:hypothetical protein QJS66_03820 [Kocuria rhizophila]|nr:hypothetical protein QJS66_03820 [Kocuria rhizophila]